MVENVPSPESSYVYQFTDDASSSRVTLDSPEFSVSLNKTLPLSVTVSRSICSLPSSMSMSKDTLEDVELITGCSVQVFVSTATDVKQTIDKYYKTQ